MFSKALEAARIELEEWGYDVPSEWLAKAIRVFAQNLSEEAAEMCEVEWSGCHYHCFGTKTATPAQILSAIEKELECPDSISTK